MALIRWPYGEQWYKAPPLFRTVGARAPAQLWAEAWSEITARGWQPQEWNPEGLVIKEENIVDFVVLAQAICPYWELGPAVPMKQEIIDRWKIEAEEQSCRGEMPQSFSSVRITVWDTGATRYSYWWPSKRIMRQIDQRPPKRQIDETL